MHLSEHMFGNLVTFQNISESLMVTFSYPDGQLGNEGVQISEAPLCIFDFWKGI